MRFEYELTAGDFARAGHASSDLKKRLKQLNIPSPVMRRAVVALFEAEVNVVAHSHGGTLTADFYEDRLHVRVAYRGPGIPDIELAMKEGYSTASAEVREMGFGAGMGLPNIKRNCDLLNIKSIPSEGTELEIEILLNQSEPTDS